MNTLGIRSFFKKIDYYIVLIAIVAFALRFINLGYSDYQGDEIKALFTSSSFNNSGFMYLLDQRKGPLQFVVTFLMHGITNGFQDRFLLRVPFALAGFLAVIIFYKLIEYHFGRRIAFFASFFFSTNGFFVALSRIVQYQSLALFFSILALYLFTLSINNIRLKYLGIYLGFISWGLSILSHYDGIFILPFALYIFYLWFKRWSITKFTILNFLLSGFILVLMLASFYVPFIFHITPATTFYWTNRFSGGSGKISSSTYLFQVYNPIYIIHIYRLLALFGFIFLLKKYFYDEGFKLKFKLLVFSPVIYAFLWFLLPFIFMEKFINLPGTHIFNYILPLTIFMAYGIEFIYYCLAAIHKKLNLIFYFGVGLVFLFIFAQTYMAFVDNRFGEYPWKDKKFLIWTFNRPSAIFHLSIFGFPYYRNWDAVGLYIKTDSTLNGRNKAYSTNERESISRYHIDFDKKTSVPNYFVYVSDPQSFTATMHNTKVEKWSITNGPDKVVFSPNGKVEIYYIPFANTSGLDFISNESDE